MNKIQPFEQQRRQEYQKECKDIYSKLHAELKREAAINTVLSNMDEFRVKHPSLEGLSFEQIKDAHYAVYRVMIVLNMVNQEERLKKAMDWDILSEMNKMKDKYGRRNESVGDEAPSE